VTVFQISQRPSRFRDSTNILFRQRLFFRSWTGNSAVLL